MLLKTIYFIAITYMLAGCSSYEAKGDIFSLSRADEGMSQIYFYTTAKRSCMDVFVNDILVDCVLGEGYIRLQYEPGKYNIKLKPRAVMTWTMHEFNIELNAGRNYYYNIYFTHDEVPSNAVAHRYASNGMIDGYNVVTLVKEQVALKELKRLRNSQ